MQIVLFPDGGFVIHKIKHRTLTISGWFDSKGNLTDAEFSNERKVRPNSPAWINAQKQGRIFVSSL